MPSEWRAGRVRFHHQFARFGQLKADRKRTQIRRSALSLSGDRSSAGVGGLRCRFAWEAVVLQTRPMSYEEMVAELRNLVGERIAVSMALQQFGPADGYLADFSGRVEPIDDPIPGVDFPVHYVRVGERGFGIPRAMFDRASHVRPRGVGDHCWSARAGDRCWRCARGHH